MKEYLSISVLLKFIKFCAVGFSGMVVDFGVTYILREKLKVQQFVANGIGFTLAATSNYVLNRVWTFQSHNPEIGLEFSKFLIFSLVGLGINTLILWFLVKKLNWNFYLSKLVAIGIVTVWNFGANFLYTFVR